MKVQIEIDGNVETVDLDVSALSLREAVGVQQVLGDDKWDQLANGNVRPDALQAILFVKLRGRYPNMAVDEFDFDFEPDGETDPTSGVS